MWTSLVVSALRITFPSTPQLPGLDQIDPTPQVRLILAQSNWTLWAGTIGSALAFQLLPIATVYWPLPAGLLPRQVQDRHAHGMATHRWYGVRMIMMMIKTVGGLVWGAAPEVRARLAMPAYPPDPGTHRDDAMQPTRPGHPSAQGY